MNGPKYSLGLKPTLPMANKNLESKYDPNKIAFWAAISDDMIGLRVGKAIVIGDSAAFTSTLLGLDWTGSAHDLAGMTGVESSFSVFE